MLFIAAAGIAGWLNGLMLRQAQPTITRRQVALIALGWLLGSGLGGILFVIGTQFPRRHSWVC